MSAPIVIADLEKNSRERVRVALDEFRGTHIVDLRVTVDLSQSSGIQTPTKKGVSVRVQLLPALRKALQDAERQAREMGLLEEEAA